MEKIDHLISDLDIEINTFFIQNYLSNTNNDVPDANHNECDVCAPGAMVHTNFHRHVFK